GLTIPLGRTEPDPFALGRAGQPHQHIQHGTGTLNPVLGLDIGRAFDRFQLSAYGQTLLFLYENGHGYQAGNRYLAGISGETNLGSNLRLGLGVDVLNEQPERWSGQVQQDGNVGRTDVLAGGLVGYAFGPITAVLSMKVPVWQKFIDAGDGSDGGPGQLAYPAIVNVALQRTFGAP
ncbi:MAG TPA: hypothetical protein VE549_07235, partial [Myxococcaceae bacterium]|nr:hypothetical protein [Myxococcaceae bacterium]